MNSHSWLFNLSEWFKKPVALIFLLFIHLVLSLISNNYKDVNGDERGYMIYAARTLKGETNRVKFDDSKSSLIALAYIPRIVQQILNPGLEKTDYGDSDILSGRYIIIAISLLIVIYLWLLLKQINLPYSMLALPFAVVDPLWLTYSSLILSDLFVGLFTTVLIYHSWQYYQKRNLIDLIIASIAIGLGLVAKFSFIPVLLGFGIGIFIILNKKLFRKPALLEFVKAGAIAIFISLIVINLSYPTDSRFKSLSQNEYKSKRLKTLKKSWIASIPIPVPQNLVQAVDLLSYHGQPDIPAAELTYSGGVYLFNHFYKGQSIWYYYWAVMAYKIPLFVLFLFLTGTVASFLMIKKYCLAFLSTFILVFYLFYGGLFNPFQIGARHLMAIYPLIFVSVGFGIYKLSKLISNVAFKSIMITGSIWVCISIGYYYPFTLSYTNELILDKRKAHWYFVPGVNDYVLSYRYAHDFIIKNPEYTNLEDGKQDDSKIAITMGTLFRKVYVEKDPKAIELWNKKPDEVKRFVLLIYHEK
jgi:hypothetical protein